MRVLALDTSCAAASVAIYDAATHETLACETREMAHGHAEALAPMVERALMDLDGGVATISRLAVCIGPGSFTGIRIGLAMARAMGLALGAPVVGISTLAAFASPLLVNTAPGVIVSTIDARHNQVYLQLFELNGRPLFAPRVAKLRDAARLIGGGPARICGNAARLLGEEAERAGVEVELFEAICPDIVAVAQLGAVLDPQTAQARPLYIKPPDAQPSEGYAVPRIDG